MTQYTTPYVDHGCLWEAPDGESYQGKIYAQAVAVEPNGAKAKDTSPDWWIWDPQNRKDSIGALWAKHSDAKGVDWLSGSITIEGQKRNVGLWPANRTKDTSPHYRVMPPREAAPPPAPAEEAPPDLDSEIPF